MSPPCSEGLTQSVPRLHYLEWGAAEGPALLLLHAAGCHAHWWDTVAPLFAERYRTIAVDLRGHGQSERPNDGDYRFEAHVADLERLIAELGIGTHRIVGHSFGGYLALQYASRQPASLLALVIADMLCELSGEPLDRLHQASRRPQPTFDTRDEAVSRFKLLPPETAAPTAVLENLAQHAVVELPQSRFAFAFDRRAMGHQAVNAWPFAEMVRCPTLVVRGANSPLMSAKNVQLLAALLQRGEAAEVSDAHHHLMLDRPEEFGDLVIDFFERSKRGG